MRGVVYGLIGTAIAQALLAGIGFWIAAVPQALLLGCLTFVMSFVPVGPALVWGSVALWLLLQGTIWRAVFITVWGLLLVSTLDNVLRPYVLGKSNDLPILFGLFGFLGGILTLDLLAYFSAPHFWRSPTVFSLSGWRPKERNAATLRLSWQRMLTKLPGLARTRRLHVPL